MKNTDSPFRDVVGIVGKLEQAPERTLPKRRLYRLRRYLERQRPGRWYVEYRRMLEAGVITESGDGKRGNPIIVQLVDAAKSQTSAAESVSGTL